MSEPPLICLITPGHAASTPRLVKNADALAEAGYRVHVVCGRHFPPADPLDETLFARARWSHTRVDALRGAGAAARKLMRRMCRSLARHAPLASVAVAARAHQADTYRLAAAAARTPARLYLGHCLGGLPAAAAAARRRGAPYGFDAEDFHDEETAEASADPAERAVRRLLQSRLLPGCRLFTAAAPLIGRAYRERYGADPLILLNVFPLAEAPAAPAPLELPGPGRAARFYWFSQTIGPGRGLEAVLAILGKMRTPAELHLRGFADPAYAARLREAAARLGLARPIRFLAPAPPESMVRAAAEFDVGVSSEETMPLNRDLCLTNKIFTYLLAGIPQLLSATAAQAAFAPELGAAALLADLGRPDEAAARLDRLLGDRAALAGARAAAWSVARERFCWDREKEAFIRSVRFLVPA